MAYNRNQGVAATDRPCYNTGKGRKTTEDKKNANHHSARASRGDSTPRAYGLASPCPDRRTRKSGFRQNCYTSRSNFSDQRAFQFREFPQVLVLDYRKNYAQSAEWTFVVKTVTFLAGCGDSGKTFVRKQQVELRGLPVLNSDDIVEAWQATTGRTDVPQEIFEEASNRTDDLFRTMLQGGQSFVWDRVCKTLPGVIQDVKLAHKAGFVVNVLWVKAPLALCQVGNLLRRRVLRQEILQNAHVLCAQTLPQVGCVVPLRTINNFEKTFAIEQAVKAFKCTKELKAGERPAKELAWDLMHEAVQMM